MISLFNLVLLALPTLLVTQWLWPLYKNYRRAEKLGFPILISPFNPENIFYLFLKVQLRPYLKKIIPTDGLEVSVFGWQFRTRRNSPHSRQGRVFTLVTPGENEIWCADPAMAQAILTRRKDFLQSPMAALIMRFQGENILTSNGETWARQRRLVAPQLNERISEVVWKESMEQADQMVQYMMSQPDSSSRQGIAGVRSIAINVLGQVGYGQPKPFKPMQLPRDPKANMNYIDAISVSVDLIVLAALVPGWILRLPFMPLSIQTLGAAVGRLPGLTSEMFETERKRIASGNDTRDNVMSMLVRLSDSEKSGGGPGTNQYLKDDEIAGNLFVFTAAGFDTTANTMGYALALLAAYPKWQTWIQEEIDFVWSTLTEEEAGAPPYVTVFPRLTRVLAVMLEIVRLFPPLLHMSRATVESQSLTISGKTYYIDGAMKTYVNNVGLHTDQSVWGPDALDFLPTRWIAPGSTLGGAGQLVTPARGSFSPWSGGPRVCPGMKMSQVEFVTVMSTLFRKCTIEPAVQPGESLASAREHLIAVTEDSQQRLTLQMTKPEEVNLKWRRR